MGTIREGKKQSPLEFMDILQREYYINLLRSKIYPKENDRNYYKRVMSNKKAKIDDIAIRNDLKTIFNDPVIEEAVRLLMIPKKGAPIWLRRDDELGYYYAPTMEVKVTIGADIEFGKVVEFNMDKDLVSVVLKGGSEPRLFKASAVTRIL